MKKNTMMRIASFLLIAVLLSTSAISGTYAKYVTKESGSDAARVAKFGVVVDVNGGMFAEVYDDKAHGNDAVISAADYVTVESDGTGAYTKLVAPGTQGEMVDITITGTPEVDVAVTYVATVDLNGWAVEGDAYYCPLVITINGADYYLNACANEEEAEALIKNIIDAYTTSYDALTTLDGQTDYLNISWQWPFETGASESEIAANDIKDTYLGDAAAGLKSGKAAASISIEVTAYVTQVD